MDTTSRSKLGSASMTENVTSTRSSLDSWLKGMLIKRELIKPNGQPLFMYQLSDQEYFQLKTVLKNSNMPYRVCGDKPWCAAFCLFCAEWYRREYSGGWSWSGILTSLGHDIEANQRSKIIKLGFKYWQRDVSQYTDDRYSFLGSVFREGGLPYDLLASQGGPFFSIFRRVLRVYDDAKSFGQSTYQLVADSLDSLPEAFHQETTIDLIKNMAELLLRLTDQYNLQKQEEPAKCLDAELPNWRNLFPIPMDTVTGNEFLSSLLQSASEQRKSNTKQNQRIICKQRLALADEFSVIAQIKLLKQISVPFVRDQLINSRVEVFIFEGNNPIAELGTGHALFEDTLTKVVLRTTACEFQRKQFDQNLYMVMFQAGSEIYREEIANTDLPVNEMPLVLHYDGKFDWIVGKGSINWKADELKILLANDMVFNSENTEHHSVSVLSDFRCVVFSGELKVTSRTSEGEDVYTITTKQSLSSNERIVINGERLPYYSTTGQDIYLGLPKFNLMDNQSQLWIGDKVVGTDDQSSLFGVQYLRLKDQEQHTLFRRKLSILPSSFRLKLKSSDNPSKGSIEIFCGMNCFVSIKANGVKSKQHRTDVGKRLELEADGIPPRDLTLEVSANLLAEPIRIRVPFPSSGVLVFDKDGHDLARRITIDELLGARAQFFPKLGNTAHYYIELKGPASQRDATFFWEYSVPQDSVVEVSLYELRHHIRELLAVSGSLDDEVRMIIGGTGGKVQQYVIGRYSLEGIINNGTIDFGISHGTNIRPVIMNLTDPEEKPMILQQRFSSGVPTGIFELPSQIKHPSLVLPAKESQANFRAKFISSSLEGESTNQVVTLNKAVALFHPLSNPNVISKVLDLMANDFGHSSWRFVNNLFERYAHLPMATFEVWKAMVNHTSCLAALAFKADNPLILLERFQVEFNVIWELIPIDIWKKHITTYRNSLFSAGLPEVVITNLINSKLDELSGIIPVFDNDLNFLVTNEESKRKNYSAICQYCFPDWSDVLVRLHLSDRGWPTAFADELKTWSTEHYPQLVHFETRRSFHTSVQYIPLFCAAVALGKARLNTLVSVLEPIHYFYLRQLVEFDRAWFNPVYQTALCALAQEEEK
ncbi:hypothetical protein I2712_004135 [Vibrio fluvialis]|nr:hypothetical protein [Vibrio fluvialis]